MSGTYLVVAFTSITAAQIFLPLVGDRTMIQETALRLRGLQGVGDIAAEFDVSRIAVMKHLAVLEEANLIVSRKQAPDRERPFKVAGLIIIGPLTIAGCLFLFFNLPMDAMLVLPIWTLVGAVIYFGYSRGHSHLGKGIVEVVDDIGGEETMLPMDTKN